MLHPRSHRHTHINAHICVSATFLNWRQSLLCIPWGTMINTSPLIVERHYRHLHHLPPSKHAHKWVCAAHSGCCSLFIHSYIGLHAWLGTASFFSPLSPSLPFPEGLVHHKPTTLIVQHTGFIQAKGTASLSHISAPLRHQQSLNYFPQTVVALCSYEITAPCSNFFRWGLPSQKKTWVSLTNACIQLRSDNPDACRLSI